MTEPAYVDEPFLGTTPAPLLGLGTTLYAFFPRVDRDRVVALLERTFEAPSQGSVRFAPLPCVDRVLLTFGVIERITPTTPPFDEMGHVLERHTALWIPVLRGDGPAGTPRWALHIPALFIDDPLSVATGREVFGVAKGYGWPRFAGDGTDDRPPGGGEPEAFSLDVYGLASLRPDKHPARRRLLDLARAGEDDPVRGLHADEVFDDPRAAARAIARSLLPEGERIGADEDDDEQPLQAQGLPGFTVPLAFLKQIRSIEDGTRAAHQSIAISPFRVLPDTFSARPLPDHELTVHPVASHPLGDLLGLRSGPTGRGWRIRFDFAVDPGTVLWRAGQSD